MQPDNITQELQARSANAAHIQHLILQLQTEQQRHDCLRQLGGTTAAETITNARALIQPARIDEINRWISKIETIKGKLYTKVSTLPTGDIGPTLHTARATSEELAAWYDLCSKTTFANGTRYQPLPSLDEAWQLFHRIRSELTGKRHAAEQWICTHKNAAPMSLNQLIEAAQNGLWEEIPIEGRRQLFKALPRKQKDRIRTSGYGALQAEQETRKHYDALYL
jgi:hypothetical protein